MDDVNLYIETRIRGLRAKRGCYSYVLEALDRDGNPREKDARSGFGKVEDATETKLVLTAITEALKRFRKPCAIRVNTECDGFLNALSQGWIQRWKKQDWKNAKGKPVNHAELWIEFTEQAEKHLCSYEKSPHKYRAWQQAQMEKMEREDH